MERRLPDLPHEIIYDILSRLPVKPLCRFKSVSKPWLALVTDPQFIKSHLNHQSTNHKKLLVYSLTSPCTYSVDCQAPDHTVAELEMPGKPGFWFLGSFNGILLLHTGNILCLWNPSIRVYQQISRPKLSKFPDAKILFGLGYDSISDDFKVVRAIRPQSFDPCIVHVFSSKLNSWKRWTADFNYDIIWRNGSGTVLNGAPHWVWYRSDQNTFFPSNQESVIVCFDATEEKFKEVPNPNYEGEDTRIHLGVLGGCLCVVEEHRKTLNSYDFWVMKEYGAKDSWTKLFVVQSVPGEFFFEYLKLLCDSKDGEVVLVLHFCWLVVYNPKQSSYKRIPIPQSCDQYRFRVAFYTESLVSPGGCNGTRRLP